MFRMFSIFTNLINIEHSSSFLSSTFVWTFIKNILSKIWNFILSILWTVCKLVFGVMEALEYMINQLLGIGTTMDDLISTGENISAGGMSYLDMLVKTFKAVASVALVLLFVFTIFAMIRQEWEHANSGFDPGKDKKGNNKTSFVVKLLINSLSIILLPLTMVMIISGVNVALTSFSNAMNINSGVTIAGQVLATSTYDSNKFRTYAKGNQRVPMTISAYNTSDVKPDELTDLSYEIKSTTVQSKLKTTATDLVKHTFLSFKDSLTYKNNKFYNSDSYADYYEQFICTSEQYQVMADFIDYAQMHNLSYKVKAMNEIDIEWKYVNEAVYDREENTLNIVYRDATDFDNDGNTNDTYTMQLTPAAEVTTPISDALDSIMGILGIGKYGDNVYKTMERDDSGTFLNLVQWANEKVLIKFSDDFELGDSSTWKDTDEIILYEYYHFSSNNTFASYSIEDLKTKGMEIDLSQIVYRDYYAEGDFYSDEKIKYCVLINGSYYEVEKDEGQTDEFGTPYYVLKTQNPPGTTEIVNFFSKDYQILTDINETVSLKLSNDFNINDSASWNVFDQILVYEYYKDLSVGNDLSAYGFEKFYHSNGGVSVPIYEISDFTYSGGSYSESSNYYVYINGTYYQINDNKELPTEWTGLSEEFLVDPNDASAVNFGYKIYTSSGEYGISSASATSFCSTSKPSGLVDAKTTDLEYAKYSNVALQLSEDFDYTDLSTWSYKDYFIFYCYVMKNFGSSLDYLQTVGISGELKYYQSSKVFYLQAKNTNGTTYYFNLKNIALISELNVLEKIDIVETLENNDIDTIEDNLFILFDGDDKLLTESFDSKEFKLSDNYEAYTVSNWTVLDYILTYMASKGILPKIDTLRYTGYNSLVYDVSRKIGTRNNIADTLYKFGKVYDSDKPEQTIFLSEYNVKNNIKSINGKSLKFKDIDTFLNLNMIEFLSMYLESSVEEFINSEESLLQEIYNQFENYIYDYDQLVASIVDDSWGDDLTSIVNYTYKNTSFKRTDLTTWNEFDVILYAITGDATGTYTAPVIVDDVGNKYVKVDDKAVLISSGKFSMTLNDQKYLQSSPLTVYDTNTLQEYFDTRVYTSGPNNETIKNYVYTDSSDLPRVTSVNYSYTTSNTTQITKGEEYNLSLKSLDVILVNILGSLTANQHFNFNLYTDGNDYFFKVEHESLSENVYIKVFKDKLSRNQYISFSLNPTMTLVGTAKNNKPLTDAGNYFAFEDYNEDAYLNNAHYLDSAIYTITGKVEEKTYKKVAYGGKEYIAVDSGGKLFILEVKANESINETVYTANAQAMIDHLYEKYYSRYYLSTIGEVDEIAPGVTQGATIYVSFDLNDARTWTPLGIILYKQGIISDGYSGNVAGSRFANAESGYNYLDYSWVDVNSEEHHHYINITNICNFATPPDVDSTKKDYVYSYVVSKIAQAELYANTYSVINADYGFKNTTTTTNISFNDKISGFLTLQSKLLTNYDSDIHDVEDLKVTINTQTNNADYLSTPNDMWNLTDLYYYNLTGEFRTQTKFVKYLGFSSDTKYYISFSYSNKEYFYSYGNAYNLFEQGADIELDLSDNTSSILEMVCQKLDEITASSNIYTLKTYTFLSHGGTSKQFYYIKSSYDQKYYGLYNFPGSNADGIVLDTLQTGGNFSNGSGVTFNYSTPMASNVHDWKIFDFLVNYASGDSNSNIYFSYIYGFKKKTTDDYTLYFKVQDSLINISMLENKNLVDYVIADGTINSSGNVVDAVGFGHVSGTPTNAQLQTSSTKALLTASGLWNSSVVTDIDNTGILDNDNNIKSEYNEDTYTPINYKPSTYTKILKFSEGFVAHDYSTWTISDFIIYYMYESGYYEGTLTTYVYKYFDEANIKQDYGSISTTNFQSLIFGGGAPVFVTTLLKSDNYGSVIEYKAINFGGTLKSVKDVYVNYDVFMEMYGRKLANITIIDSASTVTPGSTFSDSTGSEANGSSYHTFNYTYNPLGKIVDIIYDNYFHFNFDDRKFQELNIKNNEFITDDFIEQINENKAEVSGVLTVKLSDLGLTFNATNSNTWVMKKVNSLTILDYILLYEFSVGSQTINFADTSPTANYFYNMKYRELQESGSLINLYSYEGTTERKILALNGNYYDLTDYLVLANPETYNYVVDFIDKLENAFYVDYNNDNTTGIISYLQSYFSGTSITTINSFEKYLKDHPIDVEDSDLDENFEVVISSVFKYIEDLASLTKNYLTSVTNSYPKESVDFARLLYNFLFPLVSDSERYATITSKQLYDLLIAMLKNYKTSLEGGSSEYIIDVDKEHYLINGEAGGSDDILTLGSVGAYDFRVLASEVEFGINRYFAYSTRLGGSADTISYNEPGNQNVRYYRTIDSNTKELYEILIDLFPVYEISDVVKEVSWPQKLMNDMQVLYPDLNWGTLIATDGWLDTLGDYTSAYTNGMFETFGNSSNTTAAGLVLSEFFVSVANEVSGGYGNYEYNSLFDEKVLKSLMLSMLGEESYNNLYQQSQVFMQMFNSCFAPILDDIARENNIEVVDGQVDNFVMCVYKSYLATVLLSSDIGEYLYTVATRIYAEYTVYEGLAMASGDYAKYLAYVNNEPDINGNAVDAFMYSTFEELVIYENEMAGKSVPVYTYNMFNVYEYFLSQQGVSSEDIRNTWNSFSSHTRFSVTFSSLDDYYSSAYSKGESIPDNSPLYCFMLDAYWGIYDAVPKNYRGDKEIPFYLEIYRQFLTGDISRWNFVNDLSIKDFAIFAGRYEDYVKSMNMNRLMASGKLLRLLTKHTYDEYNDEEKFMSFLKKINIFDNDAYGSVFTLLRESFGSTLLDELNYVFRYNPLELLDVFDSSEEGSESSWNYLRKLSETIPLVTAEVYAILELSLDGEPTTDKTLNGSTKKYKDYIYEEAIEKLDAFYLTISEYVSAQEYVDMITKGCVTFTMGQWGQNYVTTGFNFNIENRDYTFNSHLSAQRLAEYVYGGGYLEKFGIEPVYTNSDFHGIITQSKVYDSENNKIKTKLDMWPELRKFASEIANYTAKLYYTTNLSDLPESITDGIYLTDYIHGPVIDGNDMPSFTKTTPEYLMLYHLIKNEDISPMTIARLIFGDNSTFICAEGSTATLATQRLSQYLDGVYGSTLNETEQENGLVDYLMLLLSDTYGNGYYTKAGATSASERIHMAFKSVISYLITYEENPETKEEDKINFDDMTFKDLKLLLMQKLVDYEENPGETPKENSSRYISLFNLICGQFNFSSCRYNGPGGTFNYAGGTTIDTIVNPYYIAVQNDPDKNAPSSLLYTKESNTDFYIYATFTVHESTKDNILKLAGLSNRPIEELIGLEYESLYDRNGCYDEALGDIFVLCTFDNEIGKYIPVMARSNQNSAVIGKYPELSGYGSYVNKYGINITTSYYGCEQIPETIGHMTTSVPSAYPIIAKGIITSSGLPTAIRIEKEEIQFYRTNITASSYVDEEAVSATASVSEIQTVSFTSIVESSSHKKVSGSNKKTMFIANYDLKNYISSDAKAYYLQDEIMYVLPTDEFGAISVLDEFSAFYLLNGQSYFLIILGISTLLPLLFNASAAVCRRVFDLVFLSIVGPAVISMRSIDTKEDGKGLGETAFKNWKNMVEKTLLAAFGFIIGFNIYYILAQSIMNITFVADTTVSNITKIGGFGFIDKEILESVMRYVYLLGAAFIVKGAGIMLLGLVTGGKAQNPYASALGGGKEVMQSVKEMATSVGDTAKGLVTGETLMGAIDGISQSGKALASFIPGSNFLQLGLEKMKKNNEKKEIQAASVAAQANGVPKEVADKAAKEMVEAKAKQEEQLKKQREASANRFYAQTLGVQGVISNPKNPLKAFAEGFKESTAPAPTQKEKRQKEQEAKKKGKKKPKYDGTEATEDKPEDKKPEEKKSEDKKPE